MGYVLSAGYAELYDGFMAYHARRTTEQGFKTLKSHTLRVLSWFEGQEKLPEQATIQDVLQFAAESGGRCGRGGQTVGAGTMHLYLYTGRIIFDYLMERGRCTSNPFREAAYPRQGRHLSRNVLNPVQMAVLLDALSRFDAVSGLRQRCARYRLHVIAEFLYATGLRIAEAAYLDDGCLDLDRRMVHVRHGKGGRPRAAFLTGYAADVMRRYVASGRRALEKAHAQGNNGTLFGACHDRLAIFVMNELKEVCTALDIPVISSHGFRHSLGTHLLKAGCDMRHIQVILGHEQLGTTQQYTHVDTEDLRNSLDKFHPRRAGGADGR